MQVSVFVKMPCNQEALCEHVVNFYKKFRDAGKKFTYLNFEENLGKVFLKVDNKNA